MAGIRTFKSKVPHVFRYPEWVSDIFYPAGSVVSVEIIDSDVYYDFYAAKKDVTDLKTWPPGNEEEWKIVHDVERIPPGLIEKLEHFDSELILLYLDLDSEHHAWKAGDSDIRFNFDSDIHALRSHDSDYDSEVRRMFDSERHDWKAADSDIRDDIDSDIHWLKAYDSDYDSEVRRMFDSERHDWKAADSDIRIDMDSERHDWKAGDSDLWIRTDSEMTRRSDSDRHDWKAADSDIYHRMREIDSDIAILFARTDSDEDAIQAVYTALIEGLDSEIHLRLSKDSDLRTLVVQTIHDYLSNDSEMDSEVNAIKSRLDSDFKAAVRGWYPTGRELHWGPQPFVSNTDFFIDSGTITNHNIGTLWLVDHQQGWIYIIKDGTVLGNRVAGDLLTTSVYNGIYGDFTRGSQITDSGGGADVNVYQKVGDALPLVTNANLFTVNEFIRERAFDQQQYSMDDALRRTVNTVIQIDSDMHTLMEKDSENDSDHAQFKHDFRRFDSELRIIRADVDSDNKALQHLQSSIDSEEHARRAADSDLRYAVFGEFDSDIRVLKNNDSELFVKTDSEEIARRNADSDIYNGHHSVHYRYVKPEYTPANIIGAASLSYFGDNSVQNIANYFGGWVWNSWNNYLTIVDSDGVVLYNAQHDDEPIKVSDRANGISYIRGTDTLQNVSVQLNGVEQRIDDIWNFRIEYVSKYPFSGAKIRSYIDSDLNLHQADSDNARTMHWLGEWLYRSDSDLMREEHDRKAVDSDIIAEFRIPEETITLASGTEVYTLTNPLLNEVTRWSFRSEIEANSSIYNGVVNDHFEINHTGTAWEIEVDGVQGREYVDIFVSGSATVTGQTISIPWDDNSTVTISPLSSDSTASIAAQLHEALLDKAVSATLNTLTSSVNYSADGRINPTGTITLNGISFTFLENNVVDEGFYYKDADTITIRKK